MRCAKAFSQLESRPVLVSRWSLVGRFGQELGLGRNLVEKIRASLEDALQSFAGGIDEVAGLAAEREAAGDLAVFSGGDKFGRRGDEPVGGQSGRLFGDPFFGREIGHAADEQISGFLTQLSQSVDLRGPTGHSH